MANQLNMAEQATILSLHQQGWSGRRIARELGLHRDTVRRHISGSVQNRPEVTTGFFEALVSKQATPDKVTTGSETSLGAPGSKHRAGRPERVRALS